MKKIFENKTGKTKTPMIVVVGVIALVVIASVLAMAGWGMWKGGNPLSVASKDSESNTFTINDGTGVTLTFNDRNALASGTDPAQNLTIFQKNGQDFDLKIADDGTSSLALDSTFSGLIANTQGVPSTTYFAKDVTFKSGSQPFTIGQSAEEKIYLAGVPTLSIVNDDGVTKNSDSNDEAMNGASVYTHCLTARAPSQQSSSEYGANIVFEYDASYISKVEPVSGLSSDSASIYLPHVLNQSASDKDFDQFGVMKYNEALRDGAKDEMCYKVTTTSSTPGEDQANLRLYWLPINKDLDADTLAPITGIYDEDNNIIYLGNTTVYDYAS